MYFKLDSKSQRNCRIPWRTFPFSEDFLCTVVPLGTYVGTRNYPVVTFGWSMIDWETPPNPIQSNPVRSTYKGLPIFLRKTRRFLIHTQRTIQMGDFFFSTRARTRTRTGENKCVPTQNRPIRSDGPRHATAIKFSKWAPIFKRRSVQWWLFKGRHMSFQVSGSYTSSELDYSLPRAAVSGPVSSKNPRSSPIFSLRNSHWHLGRSDSER